MKTQTIKEKFGQELLNLELTLDLTNPTPAIVELFEQLLNENKHLDTYILVTNTKQPDKKQNIRIDLQELKPNSYDYSDHYSDSKRINQYSRNTQRNIENKKLTIVQNLQTILDENPAEAKASLAPWGLLTQQYISEQMLHKTHNAYRPDINLPQLTRNRIGLTRIKSTNRNKQHNKELTKLVKTISKNQTYYNAKLEDQYTKREHLQISSPRNSTFIHHLLNKALRTTTHPVLKDNTLQIPHLNVFELISDALTRAAAMAKDAEQLRHAQNVALKANENTLATQIEQRIQQLTIFEVHLAASVTAVVQYLNAIETLQNTYQKRNDILQQEKDKTNTIKDLQGAIAFVKDYDNRSQQWKISSELDQTQLLVTTAATEQINNLTETIQAQLTALEEITKLTPLT